jgi:hypothetical protein
MKQSRRFWWLGAIALAALIGLTLLAAPASKNTIGSTYGRGPDGYGAWYEYMQKRETPITRWQRPLSQFIDKFGKQNSTTLLQVYPDLTMSGFSTLLSESQNKWIEKGNNLVILGIETPVTSGEFTSELNSPVGTVKIETTRRLSLDDREKTKSLLSDRSGTLVWEKQIGKGKEIFAVTPYLGANAYQDIPGNFPFLAELVAQKSDRILVDEYLHGFKDTDVVVKETAGSWTDYLAKTPLLALLLQGIILLVLLIWAKNRRFGIAQSINPPVINNSKAYIQALAAVLQKAGSGDFVLDVVGKEERSQLQRQLGLGSTLLDDDALISAWTEQTGRSAADLQQVLRVQSRQRRLSDPDLASWLETLQNLRHSDRVTRVKK